MYPWAFIQLDGLTCDWILWCYWWYWWCFSGLRICDVRLHLGCLRFDCICCHHHSLLLYHQDIHWIKILVCKCYCDSQHFYKHCLHHHHHSWSVNGITLRSRISIYCCSYCPNWRNNHCCRTFNSHCLKHLLRLRPIIGCLGTNLIRQRWRSLHCPLRMVGILRPRRWSWWRRRCWPH